MIIISHDKGPSWHYDHFGAEIAVAETDARKKILVWRWFDDLGNDFWLGRLQLRDLNCERWFRHFREYEE